MLESANIHPSLRNLRATYGGRRDEQSSETAELLDWTQHKAGCCEARSAEAIETQ